MSASGVSSQRKQTDRLRRTSIICLLTAAGLFLCSAVLQFAASLQRWVVFSGSLGPTDLSAEDHVYDYFFPWVDWVPIGSAAQVFGVGILLQAVGVLVMGFGVIPRIARAAGGGGVRHAAAVVAMVAAETLTVLAISAAFALLGAHALISGMAGSASSLQAWMAVVWIPSVGLVALTLSWVRSLPAAATACLFLIGSSWAGYLLATYLIAPVFSGASHDTARWTETVIALSTAAAGTFLIVAARKVARSPVDLG